MKKFAGLFIGLFLLLGLPAASYFYLKSGVDLRRGILKEMKDFGEFLPLVSVNKDASGDTLFFSPSKDTIYVCTLLPKGSEVLKGTVASDSINFPRSVKDLLLINYQFKEAKEVRFIVFSNPNDSTYNGLFQKDSKIWSNRKVIRHYNLSELPKYLENESSEKFPTYFLIDNKSHLRNVQLVKNNDDMRNVLKHLMVLIPLEKRTKVKLKNRN
jgi:hypothetical protein